MKNASELVIEAMDKFIKPFCLWFNDRVGEAGDNPDLHEDLSKVLHNVLTGIIASAAANEDGSLDLEMVGLILSDLPIYMASRARVMESAIEAEHATIN